MESDDRQYHHLGRERLAVRAVTVEEKPLIIANHRSIDPHDVQHAAAVDHHCRAMRAAYAVLCVRYLFKSPESYSRIVGSRQVYLLVSDRVFAEEIPILKG